MAKLQETCRALGRRLERFVMAALLNWWYARYTCLAMWRLRCSPRFAWAMATAAGDEFFLAGDSPSDSLDSELSYWDDDGP